MNFQKSLLCWVLAAGACFDANAVPEPAPFDLAGPTLKVNVSRDNKTLPIAQVPNLAPGDRVSIKAGLPASQSVHYLLVAAFLRGATNPPPPEWFFRCETWKRKCSDDGLTVTVPADAQQVLLFLAPETGGDFKTLVNAVRARPGAFVRASQDLNQASLDRSRLDKYLVAIRDLDEVDPLKLKQTAPLLARSLAIRVDDKCLERAPQLQAPCLMQGQNALILNDGHSVSIVTALTSGPVRDLAMEASYTPQASYGYYSPYVASVFDIAHILDSFRTAHYQYIPALATYRGNEMALALNTPPSFNDPMSVLVTALPAVEEAQLPPLHAIDPTEIYCARRTSLVLPVEGAPLVFSTAYAHDMKLSLSGKDGKQIDLPAKPDAAQGGFIVDTAALSGAALGDSVRGVLRGTWGFSKYQGPAFQLVNSRTQPWTLAEAQRALLIGREDTIHLQASSVSCVDGIMLRDPSGKEIKAEWKRLNDSEVEVKLPLKEAAPGALTLLVKEYGANEPQSLQVQAFADAARFDGFTIHQGDAQGTLTGNALGAVAKLTLKDIEFEPVALAQPDGGLLMAPVDSSAAAALKQGEAQAKVTLKDGRVIDVKAVIDAPRPKAMLLAKNVQRSATQDASNLRLTDVDELPQDAQLTFSVRALVPSTVPRDAKIEVQTADEAFSTVLSLANGKLTRVDARVVVASLDALKAFGPSAFGPLQFRFVAGGVAGAWQPLATLVRLPVLSGLQCPPEPDAGCKLLGENLFLLDSVADNAAFERAVAIPEGYAGITLPVPRPREGLLYLKLRDDPATVSTVMLPIEQRVSAERAAKPREQS